MSKRNGTHAIVSGLGDPGGEIRAPEAEGISTPEAEPAVERTIENRPWNGCTICWVGQGGIAKVLSTRGPTRYVKCQKCGHSYKVTAPPAETIRSR